MKKIIFLALVVAALVSISIGRASSSGSDRMAGRVLVKFKAGATARTVDAAIGSGGGKVIDKLGALGVLVVSVPQGREDRILAALSKNPNVEYAEPDYLAEAVLTPNDTYFAPNQWGLENTGQNIKGQVGTADADIDAPLAWGTTLGNVKMAILDSGIDQNHEDLSAKIADQKNFTTSATIDDLYGHGTHVAGIAAAVTNNALGVAGGCPNCVLMNGKVLGDNGSGAYSWVSGGIIWAADNGAKVINLSLGGSSPSKTLERAVNYAWNKGAVVVAAAGNCGCRQKIYPAAYENAIAVAATNNLDKKASFSSYGARWVDVAAPGENIFSTFPNHSYVINKNSGYDYGSGTSMAAPMTAAAAALVWSTPQGTSATAVRLRLGQTADKIGGTGSYWSSGRINAGAAVSP